MGAQRTRWLRHCRTLWPRASTGTATVSGPDFRKGGVRSRVELSTGPAGRGGFGEMTGARRSTVGKGTDATELWRREGRGARNCSL
eukprot:180971-Rhodomonas_salina.1